MPDPVLRHSRYLVCFSCRIACTVTVASAGLLGNSAAHAAGGLTDNWSIFVAEQLMYDENLYRLPANFTALNVLAGPQATRSELVNQITAGLFGEWHLSHQDVQVQGSVDDNRFDHNDSLNNVSLSASADWKWMVGHRLNGEIGANFSRSLAGFVNNRYLAKDLLDTQGYFGNFAYRTGTYWSVTASAQTSVTTHSADTRGLDDAHYTSGSVGMEYRSRAGNVLGWDYRFARGTYEQDLSLGGILVNPNFRQSDFGMRVSYRLSGKTSLIGNMSYLQQTYPDQLPGTFSPDFSGLTWRIAITHAPTNKVSIVVSGWRELSAYLDSESNYFVAQGVSAAPTWSINRKLSVKADYSWSRQDYIGSSSLLFGLDSRSDTVSSADFSTAYLLFVKGTLAASYRHENRSSNIQGLAYNDNIITVSLKFNF